MLACSVLKCYYEVLVLSPVAQQVGQYDLTECNSTECRKTYQREEYTGILKELDCVRTHLKADLTATAVGGRPLRASIIGYKKAEC